MTNIEQVIEILEQISKYQTEEPEELGDDFNPYESSGGNFDDAFFQGANHGENWAHWECAQLARTALKLLEVE